MLRLNYPIPILAKGSIILNKIKNKYLEDKVISSFIDNVEFYDLDKNPRFRHIFSNVGEINKSSIPIIIKNLAVDLLSNVGLGGYADEILNSPYGISALSNLLNWSAKNIDDFYYSFKDLLLYFAIKHNSPTNIGAANYITYLESPYGQFSFHHIEETIPLLVHSEFGRTRPLWSKEFTQRRAPELINSIVDDIDDYNKKLRIQKLKKRTVEKNKKKPKL